MRIEVVTPDISEDQVLQMAAVESAIANTPDFPLPAEPAAIFRAHAQHPGGEPIALHRALVAVDDEDLVVGFARSWSFYGENRHLADGYVSVAPAARRRGVGSALLESLASSLRAEGRTQLTIGAPEGGSGAAFCLSRGAAVALVERHSLLEVTGIDWELVEKSAAAPSGYRLQAWDDRLPEDLSPSLARAQESMDDAPKGDLAIERETWTEEMVRAVYALSAARGYRRLVVAAVHEDSGEVAGFTELKLPPGMPEHAEQEETVVIPAHRGHGLGMAIKSAQLLRLRELAPEVARISTWNAESNSFMLTVNIALGFQMAELWGMHQLSLT